MKVGAALFLFQTLTQYLTITWDRWCWLALTVLLAMLVFSLPLKAQSDTPLDAEAVLLDMHADVIFPTAIRFNLELDVPLDQIESAAVQVRPQGSASERLTVDLDALRDEIDETGGDASTASLSVRWMVPVADVPNFLAEIDYAWQIETADGQSLEYDDTVVYANDVGEWVRDDDPDERLSFIIPSMGAFPSALRTDLGAVYDLLLSQAQGTPEFRFAIDAQTMPLNPCEPDDDGTPVVYDADADEFLPCQGRVQASVQQIGYEVIETTGVDLGSVQSALLPLIVEAFYEDIWAAVNVPVWFRLGLPQVYAPQDNLNNIMLARDMVRTRRFFTLEEMEDLPESLQQQLQWRAQAYTMVLYMVSQGGVQGVFRLARTVGEDGETFAQSYERTIEQPLAALIPSWQNWIFSRQAEDAARLDLMAGPTDIPPATPTVTPFPTTPGPTDTPTITPTGFPTPRPTFTPLPTDTRTPFPSRTPRPTETSTEEEGS